MSTFLQVGSYAEIKEELEESATLMTQIQARGNLLTAVNCHLLQISAQNEELAASQASQHNYVIQLNRPILLVKATAIDKAILLWLNYRNGIWQRFNMNLCY